MMIRKRISTDSTKQRYVVIEQVDVRSPRPGGIAPCISDMISLGASPHREWILVGAAHERSTALRVFYHLPGLNSSSWFVPVMRLTKRRTFVPDTFRLAWGVCWVRRKLKLVKFVHVHRPELVLLARLLFPSAELTFFVHTQSHGVTGRTSDSLWRFAGWIFRLVRRLALHAAHKVISFNRAELARMPFSAAQKTIAVPSWFNDQLHFRDGNYQPLRIRQRLLFVGRFEAPKRIDLVLRVFAELHKTDSMWTLDLVGDGSLAKQLRSLAYELEILDAVTWHGAVSRERAAAFMREPGRLLLLLSSFEGSPRALIEALACGTPAVVSPTADTEEIVTTGINGVRLEVDDVTSIANSVRQASLITRFDGNLVRFSAKAVLAQILD